MHIYRPAPLSGAGRYLAAVRGTAHVHRSDHSLSHKLQRDAVEREFSRFTLVREFDKHVHEGSS